ncbi:hypothetical protein [Anaeromyxobacter terrae]|uniref:hypothetical protein n=1 Tax=Anaeromyxobacter terrae TaxID=2925406 RepID=UPI001F581E00|nr:hypothetical protein [Anaeromyxobacter sp. SG22]
MASILTEQPLPAAGPISPAVTPVRAPRLNGANAFVAAAGVGPTPVLSWEAPAQGEPTSYLVLLYRLDLASGGTTRLRRVASLHTTQPAIRIPWGVLEYGSTYTARISALRVPGAQVETAPFRSSYDYARADAVTATFTP